MLICVVLVFATAGSLHVPTDLRHAQEDQLGEQVMPFWPCRSQQCSTRPLMTDVVLFMCVFSIVSRFLELLTLQVLQSGSDAPSGLQFHILDVYMAELAGVASVEVRLIHIFSYLHVLLAAAN